MSEPSTSESPNQSITTRKSVEQKYNIDLIGHTSHQITGAKLPSNRQVLQVLFHNMRFVKLEHKEGAALVIDLVSVFWQQARIPIRDHHKCVDKLIKLYKKYRNIQKTVPSKRTNNQIDVASDFCDRLDDLFDIASENALEIITIEEDRLFLEMQREKGRVGSMIGVDMALFGREQRSKLRKEKEEARRKKYEEESRQAGSLLCYLLRCFIYFCENFIAAAVCANWSDDEEVETQFCEPIDDADDVNYNESIGHDATVAKRGKINFITDRLLTVLDVAKLSCRKAVEVLAATAEALGHRVENLVLNHSTLHKMRRENRFMQFEEITADFSDNVISTFDVKKLICQLQFVFC